MSWKIQGTHPIMIVDENYKCVATLYSPASTKDEPSQEMIQRAHIIAAAPDLLMGLKQVFALLDCGYLVRNIEGDADANWASRQIGPILSLQKALAAIDRAEGKKND